MFVDGTNAMECCRKFLENHAALPSETLTPYADRWIAWSPDGARIVAVSQAPEDLDDRIRAAGRTRSGAWSRVSPRQTQCSVVRGLARRDREVSIH